MNDVPDIKEQDFGRDLCAHPSIRTKKRARQIVSASVTQMKNKLSNVLLLDTNTRKACGQDAITPRLVKESASAISVPLAVTMNE